MAFNWNKDLKLYYSTREVARIFGVNESTLRFWETKFPSIRPKTTDNGVRQYSQKNIEEIRLVHNLVKVRGFRLDAACEILKKNRKDADRSAEIIERLMNVRDELMRINSHLDGAN